MKLIATDFDGTLRQNDTVDQEVLEKIDQFRALGHKFGIVTGRSLVTIFDVARQQGVNFDFIVASNGAVIVDSEGNLLFEKTIRTDKAIEILEFMENNDFPFYTCTNGTNIYGLYELSDPRSVMHKERHKNLQVSKEEMINSNHIISFVARGKDADDLERLYKLIVDNFSDYVEVYKNMWIFDVMPKGVSKKTGLDKVVDIYKPNEVYAIGDDFNDLPMIEGYNGYCVANAIDDVKKVSKKIYLNVKELIDDII